MILNHDTNIIIVSGEITTVPVIVALGNGKDKLEFYISVHRRFSAKSKTITKSQEIYLKIEAFGGLIRWGEASLNSGDKVLIVGRYQLDTNNYPVITIKSIYIIKDAYIHVEA